MIKLSKVPKPVVLVDNAAQWTAEYLACLNAKNAMMQVLSPTL